MIRVLLITALLAGPAAAADKFDLVCEGITRTSPRDKGKRIEARYLVDLPSQAWCLNKCPWAEKIAELRPDLLVFQNVLSPQGITASLQVYNRATGAWRTQISARTATRGSNQRFSTEGRCTEADFSGWPTRVLKRQGVKS